MAGNWVVSTAVTKGQQRADLTAGRLAASSAWHLNMTRADKWVDSKEASRVVHLAVRKADNSVAWRSSTWLAGRRGVDGAARRVVGGWS
jgi:hypothetical protein